VDLQRFPSWVYTATSFSKMKIAIENPIGGRTYTGRNRALRLIKAGRAVLVSTFCIRLTPKAVNTAEREERMRLCNLELARLRGNRNYDAIDRQMTPEEMAELPMVGDISKALEKPNGGRRAWSYIAGVSRRQPRMDTADEVARMRTGAA
jgi:hypothetical protein